MSAEEKSGPPPSYNQTANPNDQANYTYGNQYGQYPGGQYQGNQYPPPDGTQYPSNQYPPPGGAQYPSSQYPPPGGIQYPGNQYPQQGGAQYPSNQYQPQYGVPGQPMMTTVVAQPGSVPMVVNTTRPRTDYMVPAVLSCLCCFCPTGIFAILAASRANSAAAEGDFVEAEAQSSRARTLVIISVVVGIIVIVLGIISRVVIYSAYPHY